MHPGTEQAPNSRHRRPKFGTKALRMSQLEQRSCSSTPPASPSGDLHPSPRCPAPARRLRPGPGPATSRSERVAPSSSPSAATSGRCIRPTSIAIVLDNFSPHLSTRKDQRVSEWAEAKNVEFVYVPLYASWLNRIEAQFTALRYFAFDGTDHPSHLQQARMIRRYIAWRTATPTTRHFASSCNAQTSP